jgi:Tfp pilus assembly protein PilF
MLVTVAQAQTPNFTSPNVVDNPAPAPAPAPAKPPPPTVSAPIPTMTPAEIANRQALVEANQMIRVNDYDGAMGKVNQVIQSDPRDINAYLVRGQIYSHLKQPDKEANDFQSAHLIDPTNPVANFDLAESKFGQKSYDAARIGFADLAQDPTTFIGDLAAFKVFLCDMVGGHPDQAQKELDNFNKIGRRASYYYANATWSVAHKNYDDARGWLASAGHIYAPQKNSLYLRSMHDVGFLPLPAPTTP